MSKYVNIAKRENNNKRGFIIVNPYLGKHVPMNPSDVIDCFDDMSKLVPANIEPNKTLVIGFAETATALAIRYAYNNKMLFMQTTREKVSESSTYIYFSEEHSHATAQYIVKNELDEIIDKINDIIFIDDEITTGKTIINAISAIQKEYPDAKLNYHAISILNSMNNEHEENYKRKNIELLYLEKLDASNYEKIANDFEITDENYHVMSSNNNTIYVDAYIPEFRQKSSRKVIDFNDTYDRLQYSKIADSVVKKYSNASGNILVLGSEEYMYAGLVLAQKIKDLQNVQGVKFHATTRSPIAISNDTAYPLHHRYELKSLYDDDRTTYIYDIDKYDEVFIITEGKYLINTSFDGIYTLIEAIKSNNNSLRKVKIHIVSVIDKDSDSSISISNDRIAECG